MTSSSLTIRVTSWAGESAVVTFVHGLLLIAAEETLTTARDYVRFEQRQPDLPESVSR